MAGSMREPKMNRVALITGVGPGLGAALARRFAKEGFAVAVVARNSEFIGTLAAELSSLGQHVIALTADVGKANEISAAVARTRSEFGPIGVLVHNASGGAGGGVLDLSARDFEQAWRVTTLGAFLLAKETASDMADGGAMLFTGATSSVRGGGWLAFSSAKFALRGMVQSLARELWPKGIHVAHVLVDGIIGSDEDKAAMSNEPHTLLDPDAIAEAYWYLANQPRSAWTLELDLRPNGEEFFV